MREIVEVARQAPAGEPDRVDRGGNRVLRCALEQQQMALDFLEQRDRSVEADDLHGACRLVNLRLGLPERCLVACAFLCRGCELGQRRKALFERLVDFVLDPRQRTKVEPSIGQVAQHGVLQTLKPATDARSSSASRASSPIDTFACRVPSVVSSVIRRMPCIPFVTSVTDDDCFDVCTEMP